MKNVLVICTGNSCRSQMAQGYLEHFANKKAEIYSAGIATHGLNKRAVLVMKEDGIDISHHTSNHVDEYKEVDFDFIITVCDHAHENCPFIPSKKPESVHQNFKDPSKVEGSEKEIQKAFHATRNAIKNWCKDFVENKL